MSGARRIEAELDAQGLAVATAFQFRRDLRLDNQLVGAALEDPRSVRRRRPSSSAAGGAAVRQALPCGATPGAGLIHSPADSIAVAHCRAHLPVIVQSR